MAQDETNKKYEMKIPLHLFVCLSKIAFVEVMFPYLE